MKSRFIKIVPPKVDGICTGFDTKVYDQEGVEIRGISGVTLSIMPDEVITATIRCTPANLEPVTAVVDAIVVDRHGDESYKAISQILVDTIYEVLDVATPEQANKIKDILEKKHGPLDAILELANF